jgi:hypothetical protein
MNKERAEAFFLCERRRSRRIPDVRAADLSKRGASAASTSPSGELCAEEMTEQRSSVPSDPTKTAANQANIVASGSEQSNTARCASSSKKGAWFLASLDGPA